MRMGGSAGKAHGNFSGLVPREIWLYTRNPLPLYRQMPLSLSVTFLSLVPLRVLAVLLAVGLLTGCQRDEHDPVTDADDRAPLSDPNPANENAGDAEEFFTTWASVSVMLGEITDKDSAIFAVEKLGELPEVSVSDSLMVRALPDEETRALAAKAGFDRERLSVAFETIRQSLDRETAKLIVAALEGVGGSEGLETALAKGRKIRPDPAKENPDAALPLIGKWEVIEVIQERDGFISEYSTTGGLEVGAGKFTFRFEDGSKGSSEYWFADSKSRPGEVDLVLQDGLHDQATFHMVTEDYLFLWWKDWRREAEFLRFYRREGHAGGEKNSDMFSGLTPWERFHVGMTKVEEILSEVTGAESALAGLGKLAQMPRFTPATVVGTPDERKALDDKYGDPETRARRIYDSYMSLGEDSRRILGAMLERLMRFSELGLGETDSPQ